MSAIPRFMPGDFVEKCTGDYEFSGRVLDVCRKYDRPLETRTGPYRYFVQDDRGAIHVFEDRQLRIRP